MSSIDDLRMLVRTTIERIASDPAFDLLNASQIAARLRNQLISESPYTLDIRILSQREQEILKRAARYKGLGSSDFDQDDPTW